MHLRIDHVNGLPDDNYDLMDEAYKIFELSKEHYEVLTNLDKR